MSFTGSVELNSKILSLTDGKYTIGPMAKQVAVEFFQQLFKKPVDPMPAGMIRTFLPFSRNSFSYSLAKVSAKPMQPGKLEMCSSGSVAGIIL